MTVSECLTALGFAETPAGHGSDYEHPTGLTVCVRTAGTVSVWASGYEDRDGSGLIFPGVRTVGDVRQLLRLLGATVPDPDAVGVFWRWYARYDELPLTGEG